MKKPHLSLIVAVTLLFSGFLLGFSLGRNSGSADVIVSVPPQMRTAPTETTCFTEETVAAAEQIVFPININTADKDAFMALPGIGEVLAQRILAYREEYGGFSLETDLMNVEGIGQTRMEAILDYITTGG